MRPLIPALLILAGCMREGAMMPETEARVPTATPARTTFETATFALG